MVGFLLAANVGLSIQTDGTSAATDISLNAVTGNATFAGGLTKIYCDGGQVAKNYVSARVYSRCLVADLLKL